MTGKPLKIKKETLPTRCDVCHQADQFDPVAGVCQRCQSLLVPEFEHRKHTAAPDLPCPRCGSHIHFYAEQGYCDRCANYTDPFLQSLRGTSVQIRSTCPRCEGHQRFDPTSGYCDQCQFQPASGQSVPFRYYPQPPSAPPFSVGESVIILFSVGGIIFLFIGYLIWKLCLLLSQ